MARKKLKEPREGLFLGSTATRAINAHNASEGNPPGDPPGTPLGTPRGTPRGHPRGHAGARYGDLFGGLFWGQFWGSYKDDLGTRNHRWGATAPPIISI